MNTYIILQICLIYKQQQNSRNNNNNLNIKQGMCPLCVTGVWIHAAKYRDDSVDCGVFSLVDRSNVYRASNMADTGMKTDIGSSLFNPGGWKSLISFATLALAWLVGFSSRLFAVIRFESIIHEFDPWWETFVAELLLQYGGWGKQLPHKY